MLPLLLVAIVEAGAYGLGLMTWVASGNTSVVRNEAIVVISNMSMGLRVCRISVRFI